MKEKYNFNKKFKIKVVILILLYLKMFNDYKTITLRDKNENLICKQEEVLRTYQVWFDLNMKKKILADFFINNNYQTIGIYGFGRLGKHLYYHLKSMNINIKCIIDNIFIEKHEEIKDVLCLSINDKLPEVDLYIVTVSCEASEIKRELLRKTKSPVQSLQEIIFMWR